MDATWIVAANASRARVFAQATAAAAFEEIEDRVNDAARMRDVDMQTDGVGQRAASKSQHGAGAPTAPNGYEPKQTPVEHEIERFARDLAESLRKAHNEHRFRKLCIVAAPEFLGLLRKMLDSPVASNVTLEIDKDYTRLTSRELAERIASIRH